jgi:hypothetical protein
MKFANLCLIVFLQTIINTPVFSQENFYRTKQPRSLQQQQAVNTTSNVSHSESSGITHSVSAAPSLFMKDLPNCSEAVKERVANNKQTRKPLTDGIYKKYRISIAAGKEAGIIQKLQTAILKVNGYVRFDVVSKNSIDLIVLPQIQSESIKLSLESFKDEISFEAEDYFVK